MPKPLLLYWGGALICIVFCNCKNFLNAGNVSDEIKEAIAYNNAKEITVLVQAAEGTGSTVPSGNHKAKQGYDFEVSFTENPAYCFIKWIAVSKDNPETEITEGISFENAVSTITKVKITNDSTAIRIIPLCVQRPAVVGEPSPRYESNGVSRDRSITVEFSKALDSESFIFKPEDLPEGATAIKDENENIWAYKLENQTYLKNIKITNADDYSIAEHFTKPVIDGKLLIIATDRTKPIEFETGVLFKTIKVTLSPEIKDTDGIKMNSEKSWKYQVTEATDDKASVNLSCNALEGSVYLAGQKDYSIGQKLTLSFTETADYQFVKWNYDSTYITIAEPASSQTYAYVREKTDDAPTNITAVCAKRLRLAENGYEPKTTGNETVSKNSSVKLTFDQPLPTDSDGLAQLKNIAITVGGTPVLTSFNVPQISGNTVSFTANKSNMLDVTEGQTKTVTVTIPSDFFYKLSDGTKVTWGGKGFSFDYRIDSTTINKASVLFEIEEDSGTITPSAGLQEYSEGQEVNISYAPANGWEFRGWSVKTSAGASVPASKIKIVDTTALSTKMIVYEAVSDVKVRANAVLLPAIESFSPEYDAGGKPCDSDVVIKFNKAMDTTLFKLYSDATVEGRKGTIQIVNPSNEYEHYEEFFNEPSWSTDGKTLTLKTKNTIYNTLVKNAGDLKNIRVVFDISKVSDTDGNKLKESDAAWVYRINYNTETIAPEVTMKLYKRGFDIQKNNAGEYAAVENSTYTELSTSAFTSFSTDDYPKNHVGKKIYFDATTTDSSSGYKQLTINEKLIRTVDATETEQICEPSEPYTAVTFTKQVYEFQSQYDGVVQLDFVFEDYAGNKTTRSWYVIKDTILNDSEAAKPKLPLRNGNPVSHLSERNVTDVSYALYYPVYDNFVNKRTSVNGIITEEFDFRNNGYSGETFYNDKKSLCKYRFNWGYSQNNIINSVTGSEDRLFSFERHADKYCFVELTIIDEVGNVKKLDFNLPAQSNIVSRTEKSMTSYTAGKSFTDYFFSFDYLNESADGYIVLYTFQGNTDITASEYRIRENADSYAFRLSNFAYYDTTYCPAGTYRLYILPYTKITSSVYYYSAMPKENYTLYISYDNDGKQIVTDVEDENSEPSFPDSIELTVEDASEKKNAGIHTVHVSDSFTKTPGFTYGVCYDDSNYADFDFTVPSGKSYTAKLFAKNNNTSQVFKSDCSATINANYDNIAPYLDIFWASGYRFVSAPNNIWLFSSYNYNNDTRFKIFPTDGGSAGFLKNSLNQNEFDYYIIRKNISNTTIQYDKNSLIGLNPQKISFADSATQISLNYDKFVEGDYDVVLHLKDNNGNEGISSFSVCNITAPGSPKAYMNDSKLCVEKIKKIEIECQSFSDWWETVHINHLSDNEWQKFKGNAQRDKTSPLEFSYSSWETLPFIQIYAIYEKMIGIINPPHYNSCYAFMCPAYELKSASEKAACCKNKAVIPGLGGAYQVYYDAPCFAHTMAFPTDMLGDLDAKLTEAKSIDPSVDDETYIKAIWETKGREYGLKLINSQWLTSASTATYTAPVSEIPSGYSYVTVFHFADGTSVMSDVRQK